MTGKTVIGIDTSEKATDDIAHAVARELYGAEAHASSSLRMEVRQTVLTVAEMMRREVEEKRDQDNSNPSPPNQTRPDLYPNTPSGSVNENPTQQGDGSQGSQT